VDTDPVDTSEPRTQLDLALDRVRADLDVVSEAVPVARFGSAF